MNKKKIILSLLGCGICLVASNIPSMSTFALTTQSGNDVSDDANYFHQMPGHTAVSDISDDQIDFSSEQSGDAYVTRPTKGYFKDNVYHPKNPIRGDTGLNIGSYLGSGSTFDLSGKKVWSAIRTDYNFDMLYYSIPAGSDGFDYNSPGVSIPENYYFSTTFQDGTSNVNEYYYRSSRSGYRSRYANWHFQPGSSTWIPEDSPKIYRDYYSDTDYDSIDCWDYQGSRWQGSNSNSSNIAIEPNTSDNSGGVKAKMYDDLFSRPDGDTGYDTADSDRKLEWRFLGYSQQGKVLGNPYFPSDSDGGSGYTRGSSGAILDIYNPSDYDDTTSYYRYSGKIQSIQRLMDYDSSFRPENSYAGGMTGLTAQQWATGLSLVTNPRTETPVFRMNFGSGYSYVVAPPLSNLTGDMIMTLMTVKDSSGAIVAKFTRDANTGAWNQIETGITDNYGLHPNSVAVGNTYTVDIEVLNTNNVPLKVNHAEVDLGTAVNADARQNDYDTRFATNTDGTAGNSQNTIYSTEWYINANDTAHFTANVTVPETADQNYRITSFINSIHAGYLPDGSIAVVAGSNGTAQQVTDDRFEVNDWAKNQFNMYHGDLSPTKIELIDKNGNTVAQDAMQPGEDYKVRWTYQYQGPDRDQPYNLYFSGDITRYLPQGSTDTKHYDFKVNKQLKDKDEMTFESEYITFEIPKLDVTSKVNTPDTVSTVTQDDTNLTNKYYLDNNASNDLLTTSWYGSWDIKISNLSVYPINDRPLKDENLTVGVKYDATVSAPPSLVGSGLEFDTNDTITIPTTSGGTQNLIAHSHLKEGVNKDVTQVIQIPVKALSSGSTTEAITVWLNSDKRKYEDDFITQDNNHATTSMKVLPPNNPNNFNTGGNSYGCPIDSSNNNSWDATHETLNFSGTRKDYNNFQTGKSYKFFYYPTENTNSYDSQTLNYNESYTIDYVKFKSKFTTDKDYGVNGWVDLMDSSQKDYAKIKAGYGYELDIQATYKNDVFGRQPEQTWNGVWNCVQGAYA